MSDSDTASKDGYFQQLADISSAMTLAHGKDFAMGALVLAARFIAEGEARERAAATANTAGPGTGTGTGTANAANAAIAASTGAVGHAGAQP